jgi:hypothetical protein
MRHAADLTRPFFQELIKEYNDAIKLVEVENELWFDDSYILRIQARLARLGIKL